MSLTSLCVRRPVATLMAHLTALVLGVISFAQLPVDLLPEIDLPLLSVYTPYPNVPPGEVERRVTEPVERAVAAVPGVERVSSRSVHGASWVAVRFASTTDLDFASLHLRDRLDPLRYELPVTAGRPTVLRADPGSDAVLVIAVTGADLLSMSQLAERVLRRRLEQLDGVAESVVVGMPRREIHVELDPGKLSAFGVSVEEVARALEAENYAAAGGTVRRGSVRHPLRIRGEFRSVEEIGETLLKRDPEGTVVRIADVGSVADAFADAQAAVRHNGRPSVGLLVYKEAGANTVRVTRAVERALEQLRAEFPELSLEVPFAQARFISEAMANVVQALIVGGLLAFLVLFIFLRDPHPPLCAAAAIPLSVAASFGALHVSGVSLNVMSLGGLALGVGMLMDNGIVVLESAFRQRRSGRSAAEAATRGADDVRGAVTAATLTTIAVFLPVVYVRGVAGGLLRDFALAITFSLLVSLAVSLTLLPVLISGRESARPRSAARSFRGLEREYATFLTRCLERKAWVAAAVLVALAASLLVGSRLGFALLPRVDEGAFRLRLDLPAATPLGETERATAEIEARLLEEPGVEAVFSRMGRTHLEGWMTAMTGGAHSAILDVRLRAGWATDEVLERVRRIVGPMSGPLTITGGRTTTLGHLLGGAEGDVIVHVRGSDLTAAAAIAEEVRRRLAGQSALSHVRLGVPPAQPEVRIEVDRRRAARYGLEARPVALAAQTVLGGVVATEFVEFDERIHVLVRGPEAARRELAAALDLAVAGVTLRHLLEVRDTSAPVEILREGQQRVVPVYADAVRGNLEDALEAARSALAGLELPAGLTLELGGANQEVRRSFRSLGFALLLAVLLVYVILAAQFESLVHPLTILGSLPLAALGAVLALAISGHRLDVMGGIGLVILVGIAVNNAIVQVDAMNRLRRAGEPVRSAVRRAARLRLRPVLMTATTTLLGLLPMALGRGTGAELRTPLAVAVVGGLVSSTLLTLVVIPVVYESVERLRCRFASAHPR